MNKTSIKKLCRLTPADVILIILITGFALFLLMPGKDKAGDLKTASVFYDGKTLMEISLDSEEIIPLDLETGSMKLESGKGKVRVLESSCPQKFCVKQGWVGTRLIPIVCVPNKVIVEIKGSSEEAEYDAISR